MTHTTPHDENFRHLLRCMSWTAAEGQVEELEAITSSSCTGEPVEND